mgnify:CR=1 FL=1
MSVQRIEKIERITINDPESPTGLTSVGFKTYYTNCIYVYSQIFFHSREIAFIDRKNEKTSVELDRRIEDIDIYHKQFVRRGLTAITLFYDHNHCGCYICYDCANLLYLFKKR